MISIGKKFNIKEDEINNFFKPDNVNEVSSYIAVAKEKEISGVPFFEIGRDFLSGAQSTTNLENIIKANLD